MQYSEVYWSSTNQISSTTDANNALEGFKSERKVNSESVKQVGRSVSCLLHR